MRALVPVLGGVLLAGCAPRLAGDVSEGEGDASADDGEGDGDSSLGTGETASENDDADAGEDAGGEDDADDCGSFLGCEADVPPPLEMCDFWAKSCPPGEKCTAIASTPGSGAWDANVCVPIGTAGIGEDCMMADGPQGTDTCDGDRCATTSIPRPAWESVSAFVRRPRQHPCVPRNPARLHAARRPARGSSTCA